MYVGVLGISARHQVLSRIRESTLPRYLTEDLIEHLTTAPYHNTLQSILQSTLPQYLTEYLTECLTEYRTNGVHQPPIDNGPNSALSNSLECKHKLAREKEKIWLC